LGEKSKNLNFEVSSSHFNNVRRKKKPVAGFSAIWFFVAALCTACVDKLVEIEPYIGLL